MNDEYNSEIIIYQQEGQAVEVRLDTDQETVWLSQKQMAELFGKDVRTMNEHIKNVFSEGELEPDPDGSPRILELPVIARKHLKTGVFKC